MFEVEVKYRVPNHDAIRDRLKALNAKFLEHTEETDIYLNSPLRDFAKTDEALRVRVYGDGTVVLTYKGPRIGNVGKTREELSVTANDLDSLLEILRRLDFREVAKVVKRRDIYNYENFTIYLDTVEDLGSFVEVETMVNDKELINRATDEVLQFGDKLGLKREWIEKRTYLELVLERGNERR
ncbi:class IV adenylate cyclase [Vulcanisaeta souniana]|uniref:Adenylate cyclase n=1 Tax=Vulcanisaeta souniana JCM 11219 TaxID=1293586 RepID=A0A830DZS1_9CREN|nr:class IV adenylate cyclase [Vulcanisaeta souniana]BDR92026.1 adenylate cyclase [Vulcanisaeta souniana JCM 11219]GGI68465.1 adenylate cyclase [Vulcanisaeta souniana JCM 11219]